MMSYDMRITSGFQSDGHLGYATMDFTIFPKLIENVEIDPK